MKEKEHYIYKYLRKVQKLQCIAKECAVFWVTVHHMEVGSVIVEVDVRLTHSSPLENFCMVSYAHESECKETYFRLLNFVKDFM